MFFVLLIVLLIFFINYFLLILVLDTNERNDFKYSIIAKAVKGINFCLDKEFKKMYDEYNQGIENGCSKITHYCMLRCLAFFVFLCIVIFIKIKTKIL